MCRRFNPGPVHFADNKLRRLNDARNFSTLHSPSTPARHGQCHALGHVSGVVRRLLTLGERDEIEAQGLSQYRIAKDLGISQSNLSKFLRGDADMYLATASLLLDYLGFEIRKKSDKKKK